MPMSAIYVLITDSALQPTHSYNPDEFPLTPSGEKQ